MARETRALSVYLQRRRSFSAFQAKSRSWALVVCNTEALAAGNVLCSFERHARLMHLCLATYEPQLLRGQARSWNCAGCLTARRDACVSAHEL